MEKTLSEMDIKNLEEEIDSAVDRLFVEKRREDSATESLISRPAGEVNVSDQRMAFGRPLPTSSPDTKPPEPTPVDTNPMDALEAELISLEREVTKENIGKTKEEVLALRRTMNEGPEIGPVLDRMETVLNHLIDHEGKAGAALIPFLLDSKETIKLLRKRDIDNETSTYRRLANAGIEARFSCLEDLRRPEATPSTIPLPATGDRDRTLENRAILEKMDLFSGKMDQVSLKIDQVLSKLEAPIGTRPASIDVTIFRVGERLFGIESGKVFKIYRIPESFFERYATQEKIRVKDMEIRMIDLNKTFSVRPEAHGGEIKLLMLKDHEGYKGLMVDHVLKSVSTPLDEDRSTEYVLGWVHWKYEDRPVEVPVLNLEAP